MRWWDWCAGIGGRDVETRWTPRRSAQSGLALGAGSARKVSREAANRKGKTRKVRMRLAAGKGCSAVEYFYGAKRNQLQPCAVQAYEEFSRLIFSVRGFARNLFSLTYQRCFAVGPNVLVVFVFQSSFFPGLEGARPLAPSPPAGGRIGSWRLGGAGVGAVFWACWSPLAGLRVSESGRSRFSVRLVRSSRG